MKVGARMQASNPFKGRHYQAEIIVLCVRWYLRYSLSYRDLEEMMAERGLSVDHSTIARWVFAYAPILNERMRRHLRSPNRSRRVDETYVRVGGIWTYLYRALDSEGNTIEFMLWPHRDRIAAKALPAADLVARRAPAAASHQRLMAIQHIRLSLLN